MKESDAHKGTDIFVLEKDKPLYSQKSISEILKTIDAAF